MKLTKLICMSTLFFISNSALANFYVVGYAGIFQGVFNNKYLDQTDIIKQNIVQSSTQYGYTGGLALGYTHLVCQNYFIGGELSASKDGSRASFQSGAATSAFSDQIKIKDHFDLTFLPGLMLSNTIAAYLKLGVAYAQIEDKLSSPSGFIPTINNYNSNKNSVGFVGGLGVAKFLTDHVTIFTEAVYHDYGSKNFSDFNNFTATYTHSAHVYSYEVLVGAGYIF